MDVDALPFFLHASGPVLEPPRPSAALAPGICTPQDLAPFYHAVMPISSRVGSSLSHLVRVAWFEHRGAQAGGGVTKLDEYGLGLSFPSRALSTSGVRSDP
jgi:hypothetical protein